MELNISHTLSYESMRRYKVKSGKFKMSISSDHMLEACRPFGDNGHVKMCINEAFPS